MRAQGRILFFALLLACLAEPAAAQLRFEPTQLPANTTFYVYWRGTASFANLSQVNSLLALWNDPEIAPLRAAMADGIFRDAKKGSKRPLQPDEIQALASGVENAMLFGWISQPDKPAAAPRDRRRTPANQNPVGLFVIYDLTGKEALLQKLDARWREEAGDKLVVSRFTVGAIEAEKWVTSPDSAFFRAFLDHRAVIAFGRKVFEEMVTRLANPGAARDALGGAAEFQQAQARMQPESALEFFLRVPDLQTLAAQPASPQPVFDTAGFIRGLRLDSLHSVFGDVKLAGPSTQFRFNIAGSTAPGSLFDLWASGDAPFGTLALASADTVSYRGIQFDLGAFYETLRRAVTAALPPSQQAGMAMMEAAAGSRMGMNLGDALHLFTGEFAALSTGGDLDPAGDLYALAIQKKPEVLRLLRMLLSERISSERNEGDVTYLKVSLGGSQGDAGVAQWRFYHLAVAPSFLLGAPKAEALRAAVERLKSASPSAPSGLAAEKSFLQARARFPQKVNSISYVNFSKVNWEKVRDRLLAEARKSPAAKTTENQAWLGLLEHFHFDVLRRHLHTAVGASWKDNDGLNSEGWID